MLFKRFRREDIAENIEEIDFISVPGIKLFRKDFLNTFLEDRLRDTVLNINTALLLNKYPWWYNDNSNYRLDRDFKEFKRRRDGSFELDRNGGKKGGNSKHQYKNELYEAVAQMSVKKPEKYSDIRDRHYSAPEGVNVCSTVLTTKTRLIIGLSASAPVFEAGITLHPYFGFPVIPASSIKGVTRHYCEDFKEGEMAPKTIAEIFGGRDQRERLIEGNVVFYDAWPEDWPTISGKETPLLEMDIINPHYKDYYDKGVLPADNQDPNPVKFLVVRKGVSFRFAVRPSSKCRDVAQVSRALSLVKEAVTKTGIGAKTGSSYGYFR